jgi:alpha-beta hydrolase superfamily lysophospholipase
MQRTSFFLNTSDGAELHVMKWYDESVETPKAIVQIAHGMAEHIERYDNFAKKLISHQIFVYGNDHRGHGLTAKEGERGYFADKDGFEQVVQDMYSVTEKMKAEYPSVPIILFGHSMGSFLSRRYAQLHGDSLSGLILSGTGDQMPFMLKAGKWIASWEMKRKGRKAPSSLLDALSFGRFNRGFRPNRTPFDWLSRDEKEVDKYINDPLCGGIFTSGFFYDLFTGNEAIMDASNIAAVPKKLPIFFISGDQDPVGRKTKGVLHAYDAFKKCGIEDVSYKFYKDSRHEILNEENKQEVYNDVLRWIEERL